MTVRVKCILIEDDEIFDDDQKISIFFDDIFFEHHLENTDDPLEIISEEYKNYPSILAILQEQFAN